MATTSKKVFGGLVALIGVVLFSGWQSEPRPLFDEIAESAGLRFVHDNGLSGQFYLAEIVGSGVALIDFDRDGDQDVYLVQGGPLPPDTAAAPSDQLFRNDLEKGSLRFTNVTTESGIRATGFGMGVAVGDFDNDGWPDLYVTNLGPNQLWRNQGDGTFRDVTASSGTGDPLWGTSTAFFDYDRDGWLDLFVTNYVDFATDKNWECFSPSSARDYCGPQAYQPLPDRLFHNQRDGTFREVTERAGMSQQYGAGLGVVTADFNGDGWLDIYVANDGMANQMWINQRDGTFSNEALLAGAALNRMGQAEAGMGVDAADFDEDGDEDLFMTHLTDETNTLYLNDGKGFFEDRSLESQLGMASFPFTGFGTGWIDLDSDGWLDLFVANGAVRLLPDLAAKGDPYPLSQPNQLFRNLGNGQFQEVSGQAGRAMRLSEVSRGSSFGDLDNDGDVDILVTNSRGPARLLLNQWTSAPNWLGLQVIETNGREALGALVKVVSGNRIILRRVRTAGSFCSANDGRVLIGLGEKKQVERIEIVWPDGSQEVFPGRSTGLYHILKQGTSAGSPMPQSARMIQYENENER